MSAELPPKYGLSNPVATATAPDPIIAPAPIQPAPTIRPTLASTPTRRIDLRDVLCTFRDQNGRMVDWVRLAHFFAYDTDAKHPIYDQSMIKASELGSHVRSLEDHSKSNVWFVHRKKHGACLRSIIYNYYWHAAIMEQIYTASCGNGLPQVDFYLIKRGEALDLEKLKI